MFQKKVSVLLAASLLLLTAGCSDLSKPMTKAGFALNTTIDITVYDSNDKALLDSCFKKIEQYEELMSKTISTSDISRINAAGGKEVAVAKDTLTLLQTALEISRLSNGAFDCTIAPVSNLWDFTAKDPAVPNAALLQKNTAWVDYRTVIVGKDTVKLGNPKAALDLGGIAKGYIADRISEYLASQNVKSALINLGGNVLAVGDKKGKPWNIGICNPQKPDEIIATVAVKNQSVVTSGSYERYFMKDGIRYHHLLDPKTGMPVHNGLASVTIVSDKSDWGDGLSTACFVLGEQRGMELIESINGIEALFVKEDGSVAASQGLQFELK